MKNARGKSRGVEGKPHAVFGAWRRYLPARRCAALLLTSLLIAIASCGDGGSDGELGQVAQASHTCTPPQYQQPPCWQTVEVSVGQCQTFPDYASCAGPMDPSNPLPFVEQVQFLWKSNAGSNPVQTRLRADHCDAQGECPAGQSCEFGFGSPICFEEPLPDALGVLHGVVQAGGSPLAGVYVTTISAGLDDQTSVLTEWGAFDPQQHPPPAPTGRYLIAVNAGKPVRLRYSRTGYHPAERVVTPVAGQYILVPPVELMPIEPPDGTVSPNASGWQVVEGQSENDGDGTRKVRVFVQPDTEWSPASAACFGPPQACSSYATETACRDARCEWTGSACTGEPAPCESWHDSTSCGAVACSWDTDAGIVVREYTVGANGPERMPASLPPSSAYTYAIEASMTNAAGVPVHRNPSTNGVRLSS